MHSGFAVPPPLPEGEDEPTPTLESSRVYAKSAFDATQDQDLEDLVDQESLARQPCLTVVAGKQMGQTFVLPPGTTSIGRAPGADLLVDEAGVSRQHADIIVLPEEQVILKDRNSTNGTIVNGDVVKNSARALKDGDKIQVGSTLLLKFSYQDKLDTTFQQHLYDSAVRDALTGVYNKRYLDERMEQEWAAHLRYKTQLSLLILDIDHFKRINDTLGHSAGDRVLRAVAHTIQRSLRKEEVFARYGGEEFVVLLRESTLESAEQCAERMRQLVEIASVPWEDESVRVTILARRRVDRDCDGFAEGPALARRSASLPGEAAGAESMGFGRRGRDSRFRGFAPTAPASGGGMNAARSPGPEGGGRRRRREPRGRRVGAGARGVDRARSVARPPR